MIGKGMNNRSFKKKVYIKISKPLKMMLSDFFNISPTTRRTRKIISYLLIILAIFFCYMRRDIVIELIGGRPLGQVDITQLILPIILFLIAFFLLNGKKAKDKIRYDSKDH